jgi:hypothetical protein
MKIVYLQDNGRIAVVTPTQWAIDKYGINAVAQKDVPAGVPYKIVADADIPSDRSQRDAWTCNPADLTDGVGAVSNDFPPG